MTDYFDTDSSSCMNTTLTRISLSTTSSKFCPSLVVSCYSSTAALESIALMKRRRSTREEVIGEAWHGGRDVELRDNPPVAFWAELGTKIDF